MCSYCVAQRGVSLHVPENTAKTTTLTQNNNPTQVDSHIPYSAIFSITICINLVPSQACQGLVSPHTHQGWVLQNDLKGILIGDNRRHCLMF